MIVQETWSYALAHLPDLMLATRQHVALAASALALALVICVPLGVWTAHTRAGRSVVAAVTALRVVPSLAVLAFVLPFTGVGYVSALVALTLLACPPILINTDVAFRDIEPSVLEAARGMGMHAAQRLRRVEYPLALPVMIAGLRTSTVEVIASATLAAFIGGGGLGNLILDGLANNDMRQLVLGGATVAVLAIVAESGIGLVERRVGARYGRLAVV